MKRKISLLIAVGIILLQLSADPFAIWASESNGNNANAAETETTKYKLILSTPEREHLMGEFEADELIKSTPANPVIEGHKFWGWYEEPNGVGIRWYFQANTMPAYDVTLYGYFTIESYTATLISEERTATQTVVYQKKINEPKKPVKAGYTFIGWYDAETGGKKWDFANDLMPGKNITLYAQFASKTYPMTFDNGGVTTTETVDYDGLAEEPTTPTKAGYTFDGWYDAETGGKKWDFATNKIPANDLALYARFTKNPVAPVDPVDPVNPIQPADPAHQDDPVDNILPATEKTNITAAVKPANDPAKITKQSKELPKTGDQENILYLLIGLLLIAGTFGYFKKMSHK
ncbi:TPA: InlB B-repeat-containing protein [Listeria monocytogenes]|nr:InlB B-repeat-containing protein [Listeria monocytogenes]